MDILASLFATYPAVNVSLQDFVNALTPGAPGFTTTLATVLVTFLLGFMVYIYSFILVNREKSGPYPLWMHTFYCAADFMGIWVFLWAYLNYDHFWFFLLGAIGEVVWVGFELYCLWRAVTYEREEIWGKDAVFTQGLRLFSRRPSLLFCQTNSQYEISEPMPLLRQAPFRPAP